MDRRTQMIEALRATLTDPGGLMQHDAPGEAEEYAVALYAAIEPHLLKTVHVVFAGEYADRTVCRVFAREEDAASYDMGDDYEEWDVTEGPMETEAYHTLRWYCSSPSGPSNPLRDAQRLDRDAHSDEVVVQWWTAGPRPAILVSGWDLKAVEARYVEERAKYEGREA